MLQACKQVKLDGNALMRYKSRGKAACKCVDDTKQIFQVSRFRLVTGVVLRG